MNRQAFGKTLLGRGTGPYLRLLPAQHNTDKNVDLHTHTQGVSTDWTVWGSIPSGGEARFSAPVQTGPGAHPAYYTMDTGTFPGGKVAGAPSSAEVKERVELYLHSPSGPSWSFVD